MTKSATRIQTIEFQEFSASFSSFSTAPPPHWGAGARVCSREPHTSPAGRFRSIWKIKILEFRPKFSPKYENLVKFPEFSLKTRNSGQISTSMTTNLQFLGMSWDFGLKFPISRVFSPKIKLNFQYFHFLVKFPEFSLKFNFLRNLWNFYLHMSKFPYFSLKILKFQILVEFSVVCPATIPISGQISGILP